MLLFILGFVVGGIVIAFVLSLCATSIRADLEYEIMMLKEDLV